MFSMCPKVKLNHRDEYIITKFMQLILVHSVYNSAYLQATVLYVK